MGQAPRGDTRQSAVLQAVRVQQVGSVLVSVGTCYTARESKITALPPKAFSLEEKDQPFWKCRADRAEPTGGSCWLVRAQVSQWLESFHSEAGEAGKEGTVT